jgi:hypothetical protein
MPHDKHFGHNRRGFLPGTDTRGDDYGYGDFMGTNFQDASSGGLGDYFQRILRDFDWRDLIPGGNGTNGDSFDPTAGQDTQTIDDPTTSATPDDDDDGGTMSWLKGLVKDIVRALGGSDTQATGGTTTGTTTGGAGGAGGNVNVTIGNMGRSLQDFNKGIAPLVSFFVTGDEGKNREHAARLQQQIEQTVTEIERRYVDGEIEVSTALQLMTSVNGLARAMMASDSPHFQSGGALAQRTINNVQGNLTTARNREVEAPYDPTKGFTGGESKQRANLRNLMRDLGAGSAETGLEGSKFAGLFDTFDVGGALGQAKDIISPGGNLAGLFTQPGTAGDDRLRQLRGEGGEGSIFDDLRSRREARASTPGLDPRKGF